MYDLKKCFSFDDNGLKPVRASGSRWIAHKVNAMTRVVSKFGAYTCHLAALSEDSSVRPPDRAKLNLRDTTTSGHGQSVSLAVLSL